MGTKRIGLALSDETGAFALPLEVIEAGNEVVDRVDAIAHEHGVQTIVMGESKDYQGNLNKIMTHVYEFKKALEIKGYTVVLEPEFMTSTHAGRFQGKNELLDASAAALILQSYLDRTK